MNWKTLRDCGIVLADFALMLATIKMIMFFAMTMIITWILILKDLAISNPMLVKTVSTALKYKLPIYTCVIPIILISTKWRFFRTTRRIDRHLRRRFREWKQK